MPTCPKCRSVFPENAQVCSHDGETLLPDAAFAGVDPDLMPGSTVGEYQIEGKLGEGGFGAVYAGVHPLIGKRVAVKVLNREYSSNPQMVSRFIAEARAVNQIQHQNIIDIFAFGSLPDRRQYYVMELLDGLPFDDYIGRKGRLQAEEAIPILRQIARALDAAHAKGIVHRDLKPENIYLAFDADGRPTPKLLDFGIAKLLGDHTSGHKTNTGAPIGTPYYMSPEQCRGTGVDHRTDIYSFGVMCFETLTGQRPFVSEQMLTLMMKHINDAPPLMSSVVPGIPDSLDPPIHRMLAKDPADRPQSVAAAVEELAAAAQAAGLNVTVSPLSGGGHSVPTPRFDALLRTEAATAELSPSQQKALQQRAAGAETQAPLEVDTTQSRSGPRWALIAGASLTAVLGLAAAGVLLSKRPTPVTADSLTETPAKAPTASAPASATVAATDGKDSSPQPSASAPPPSSVSFSVDSNPKSVQAYLDDKLIGSSDAPLKLDYSQAEIELEFRAPGYLSKQVRITPKRGGVISVSLTKLQPRQAPAKPQPAPPKPKPGAGELENPF